MHECITISFVKRNTHSCLVSKIYVKPGAKIQSYYFWNYRSLQIFAPDYLYLKFWRHDIMTDII